MRDPKRHQQLADWGFTAVRLGKDGDGDIKEGKKKMSIAFKNKVGSRNQDVTTRLELRRAKPRGTKNFMTRNSLPDLTRSPSI